MRIAGIIAEYDPFHNGHAAHIANTRSENGGNATHVVCVISGSFTQRGEPALLSKFKRAEMALSCGADLVLELPLPWAMAPAEHFASGGVAVLNALGCVDLLSFGSECGDATALKKLANLSTHPIYVAALKQALENGVPYAVANQSAAEQVVGVNIANHLASPNNTLGIEYLRAITVQNANWEVYTMQRQGVQHGEKIAKDAFASATLLREMTRDHNTSLLCAYMPEPSHAILQTAMQAGEITSHTHRLENALLAQLRRLKSNEFTNLPWLSEGLENRLYRESRVAQDYTSLLNAVQTRRYPMARLRRVLWASLLGLTAEDTHGLPPYIRVLGMNDRGREILAAATPTLPILTRSAQIANLNERAKRIFALECTATDLHALTMAHPLPCGTDHTTKLIVKCKFPG